MKKILLLLAVLVIIGAGCASTVERQSAETTVSPDETQKEETSQEVAEIEEVNTFKLVGNSISSNDLDLEVPEDYYVDISKKGLVRVQNYSIELERAPENGFFMLFNYEEAELYFIDDYEATESTTYQGHEVIKGDGCLGYCIENEALHRGYYFADTGATIRILPKDQEGLEAAEALLSTVSWK